MKNRGLFFSYLLSTYACLTALSANAQFPGVGWLLNPEGSRLFPQSVIYPRHPGKPDPRWKVFDWHYRDTTVGKSSYRLYFYDVSEKPGDSRPFWTAEYASPIITQQVQELVETFQFWPKERFSYLLFSSYREFQQANIFFIEEGVQGITSTQEPTMAIPYWGERETFRHISHHELVHQFQIQKVSSLSEGRSDSPLLLIPLWFIEGMAEYYSQKGIDPEAKTLLRDLWFFPREESEKKDLLNFFESGPLDFQHVYKLGQLKNAFLEETFGRGSIQRILEESSKALGSTQIPNFSSVVIQVTKKSTDEIQRLWKVYFQQQIIQNFENYEDLSKYSKVSTVSESLDHFSISPRGSWLFTREIDPLTGAVSLYLSSLKNPSIKTEVTHDRQSSAVNLYFFQAPILAVTETQLAFMTLTTDGPELEFRSIHQDGTTGPGTRVHLSKEGLLQAHSPSFSPNGDSLVFVGVNNKGWQNLYILEGLHTIRQLTYGNTSWRTPTWTQRGILVSSDKIPGVEIYGLFLVDPNNGTTQLLIEPDLGHDNLLEASSNDPSQEIFFRSANGTGQQIYRWTRNSGIIPVSAVKTQLLQPSIVQNEKEKRLYALGLEKGRYHLISLPIEEPKTPQLALRNRSNPLQVQTIATEIPPFPKNEIRPYRSFFGTGIRVEDLAGFYSSGAAYGLAGTLSDLMRNYVLSVEFLNLGAGGGSNANVFLTSEKGRTTWTVGAYTTQQLRLDAIYDGDLTRTYRYREYGLLTGFQYPLGAFSSVGGILRLGGAHRTNLDDASLIDQWNALNPGPEFILSPTLSYGFDQIQYELYSGPLRGFGLLLEAQTDYFPKRNFATERLRLDIAQYEQLWGRSLLAVQGLAGFSFNLTDGVDFRNPFLVSSDDIFRGYPFLDDRLRGNYLLGAKTELRFPIGSIFKFEPLRGILAADFGSVWRKFPEIHRGATASTSGGIALNLPPVSFSFLVSKPIRVAPGPEDSSVFHFTLRYLYL